MVDILSEAWFFWALVVVLGVPLSLIFLTQFQAWLRSRGSSLGRPVGILRDFVIPAVALWVLVVYAGEIPLHQPWVRVLATIMGFLILVFALSALNAVLFGAAREGTWRARMPSIFVDLARLVLVVLGLALILSFVWDADVGGMFAALGVTGIVLGLALQGAIGSVVSGLLLLFEQPFRIGDRLDASGVKGRVVEVNWRSVHIDTGAGIHVIPNASLGGAAFVNLSKMSTASETFDVAITNTFAATDRPAAVTSLLAELAADLPTLAQGSRPGVRMIGPAEYETTIPVATVSDRALTISMFHTWLWYAARRAGLSADGAGPGPRAGDPESQVAFDQAAAQLSLAEEDKAQARPVAMVQTYGDGELVQREDEVPSGLSVVLKGRLRMSLPDPTGHLALSEAVEPGSYIGERSLTSERAMLRARAVGEVTVVYIPKETLARIVGMRPVLARRIGQTADLRTRLAEEGRAAQREHENNERVPESEKRLKVTVVKNAV